MNRFSTLRRDDIPRPAFASILTLCPAFLCLALLAANQSAFALGVMPLRISLALALGVLALAVLSPVIELPREHAVRPKIANIAFGIVILAPLAASLVLGWNREFPFSGDHAFHVSQAYLFAFWWATPLGSPVPARPSADIVHGLLSAPWRMIESRLVVFLILLAIIWRCYRLSRLLALFLALAALIAWGLSDHVATSLRYPAGGYLPALPFAGLAYLLGNPELTGRMAGVLAPVAWLFLLRPWILGRWPDARILPVAALLFWQKDVLYYFDSAYIEPWAVIFLLLAAEALIARAEEGAAVACLLVGCAAAVKEPAIFALPFAWLAGAPWRGPWRRVVTLTGVALAGGIPFLLYYAARLSIGNQRGVSFDLSALHPSAYFEQYIHRLAVYYSGGNAIPTVAALVALPLLLWRKKQLRLPLACCLAGAFAIFLLFALDENSQPYTGYFRFLLLSLPLLAAGAIAFGYVAAPRVALIAGLVTLALNAPDAETAVALSAGPGSDRNFVEHYDAPLVFPLKSLVTEAKAKGFLPPGAVIRTDRADIAVEPVDMAMRLGVRIEYGPVGELYCECQPGQPNVMALFVRYANLDASISDHPPRSGDEAAPPRDRDLIWRQELDQRPACLAKMRRSCKHVVERVEGGEVVGALGTSR